MSVNLAKFLEKGCVQGNTELWQACLWNSVRYYCTYSTPIKKTNTFAKLQVTTCSSKLEMHFLLKTISQLEQILKWYSFFLFGVSFFFFWRSAKHTVHVKPTSKTMQGPQLLRCTRSLILSHPAQKSTTLTSSTPVSKMDSSASEKDTTENPKY